MNVIAILGWTIAALTVGFLAGVFLTGNVASTIDRRRKAKIRRLKRKLRASGCRRAADAAGPPDAPSGGPEETR